MYNHYKFEKQCVFIDFKNWNVYLIMIVFSNTNVYTGKFYFLFTTRKNVLRHNVSYKISRDRRMSLARHDSAIIVTQQTDLVRLSEMIKRVRHYRHWKIVEKNKQIFRKQTIRFRKKKSSDSRHFFHILTHIMTYCFSRFRTYSLFFFFKSITSVPKTPITDKRGKCSVKSGRPENVVLYRSRRLTRVMCARPLSSFYTARRPRVRPQQAFIPRTAHILISPPRNRLTKTAVRLSLSECSADVKWTAVERISDRDERARRR